MRTQRAHGVIVSPTDYPRFVVNYGINYFPEKKTPLNLESQNRGSPKFPNQILRQIGPGVPELCSDIQTNKTDKRGCNFIFNI